ncbi:MAG: hypothetical protein WC945_08680 [Bacteroidales bacterium]
MVKQLAEYFERLEKVGDIAVECLKEQIDIEAESVEQEIRENTPEDTGGLKASFTKTKIQENNRYGYRLEYEGNNPKGVPYAKIANVLNSGTSTIKPKSFIRKAVRKLRGLDDRATNRFEGKTNRMGN